MDTNNNANVNPGPNSGQTAAPGQRKLKVIDCPSCGSPIPLRALGQSVMVACARCGTQLDVSKPEIQIIQKFNEAQKAFSLQLGARGTIRGQLFEVVGALERIEGAYGWQEYLLFNPYIGFRWLVHDSGHWSFCETIKDTKAIGASSSNLTYQGNIFKLFHSGSAEVRTVIGEFYWRVAAGDKVVTADYISPPYMLSKEKSDDEITWSLLTYLDPTEIETAFKIHSPERRYIAPNQPNPNVDTAKPVLKIAAIAFACVILVQLFTAFASRDSVIPLGTIDPAQATGDEATYGPFTLKASHSLIELDAAAYGLDNSWVELSCSLVNTQTGTSYDFVNGFEHYSGYDSDGSWSEGNDHHAALVTDVPSGEYNLVINTASGTNNGSHINQPIQLSMRHDVTPWQNFWLVLIALLLYPGYLFYQRFSFEKERWSNSELSPYSSSGSDDDD